jgi:hypothetical protein
MRKLSPSDITVILCSLKFGFNLNRIFLEYLRRAGPGDHSSSRSDSFHYPWLALQLSPFSFSSAAEWTSGDGRGECETEQKYVYANEKDRREKAQLLRLWTKTGTASKQARSKKCLSNCPRTPRNTRKHLYPELRNKLLQMELSLLNSLFDQSILKNLQNKLKSDR